MRILMKRRLLIHTVSNVCWHNQPSFPSCLWQQWLLRLDCMVHVSIILLLLCKMWSLVMLVCRPRCLPCLLSTTAVSANTSPFTMNALVVRYDQLGRLNELIASFVVMLIRGLLERGSEKRSWICWTSFLVQGPAVLQQTRGCTQNELLFSFFLSFCRPCNPPVFSPSS